MPRFAEKHTRTPRPSQPKPEQQPLTELQWATADMLLACVGDISKELLAQRLGEETLQIIADDVPLYTEAFAARFERIIDPDEPEQLPKHLGELRACLLATGEHAIEDIKDKLGIDALPEDQQTALRNLHHDLCRTFIEAVASKRDVALGPQSGGRH